MSNTTPTSTLVRNLIEQFPVVSGVLLALFILFTIFQAQQTRLDLLQEKYFLLTSQCARLEQGKGAEDVQLWQEEETSRSATTTIG